MKLYNVFNLYVIKKENIYFICKKDYHKDTYIEFFTKDKIKVKDKNDVKLLSDYYTLFVIMNYKTKQPLMLTRKQILLKYIEINEKVIDKKENYNKRIDGILNNIDSSLNDFKLLVEKDPNSAKIMSMEEIKSVLDDSDYCKEVIIRMWETYVDSKKDSIDIPIKNVKQLKKK